MFGMGQDFGRFHDILSDFGSYIFQKYASCRVRVAMILFVLFDGFLMCDVLFLCLQIKIEHCIAICGLCFCSFCVLVLV